MGELGGPAVLLVVACGLVTVPWRPARQFALPLVAWFFMSMELFFTPD
ncbi:hypothetical protein [Rhodococcus opacus]|nr:hypothetical protein [Rhodococcus opacus]